MKIKYRLVCSILVVVYVGLSSGCASPPPTSPIMKEVCSGWAAISLDKAIEADTLEEAELAYCHAKPNTPGKALAKTKWDEFALQEVETISTPLEAIIVYSRCRPGSEASQLSTNKLFSLIEEEMRLRGGVVSN